MSTTQHAPPQPRDGHVATTALRGAVVLALISGAILLFSDVLPFVAKHFAHAPTSALPLLIIGVAYALAQGVFHPQRWDLVQAVLVSTAFISWGISQLLPTGSGATLLGDLVITMYVVDLGIGIWRQLQRRARVTPAPR